MKIERAKNATRNIIFGVVLKLYEIIIPFFMRTAMIYVMGAQYLGLNSLFSSVLSVLNLAELGVGSAMVYSMYKPIVDDDAETICALMNLYKKYYRVIGFVILICGGILTPFIPQIIKTDTIPKEVNVYILYLMNLGATVVTYWLYAYKNCLLAAYQRNDISSKISMIGSTITYILQLSVIFFLRNFYLYTFIFLAVGALKNLITALVVDRLFPKYHARGELPGHMVSKINQRVKDLFTSKVGSVVYDSVDTIVISAFLGLRILAIYQNYYFILVSVTGFIAVIFNACTAGIGNSLVVESKEKNYQDFEKFTFIICWIGGFCTTCLLCLYQPFMELWVGKSLMLDFSAIICFAVYFYVRQINALLNLYKDASGMWHEDKWRPLAAAMANLILNLILVQFMGIYGIILSTVLAILCVGEPWLLYNLFTIIFEKNRLWRYLRQLVIYTVVVIAGAWGTYVICEMVQSSVKIIFIVRIFISCIIPNLFYLLIYRRLDVFRESVYLADRMSKGKLHKILMTLIKA